MKDLGEATQTGSSQALLGQGSEETGGGGSIGRAACEELNNSTILINTFDAWQTPANGDFAQTPRGAHRSVHAFLISC